MLYTNDYAIGAGDRLALLQSYVFNASVREIYAALLNGAALHLFSLKKSGVHHLAGWLQAEEISVLYLVPATLRVFLGTLHGQHFDRLRLLRVGGEAVLASDVACFKLYFKQVCVLANALASTETGTICQYFIGRQMQIVGSSVPAGFEVVDKSLRLLDEVGCPVADGAVGEIVVSSAYLGPGYFPVGAVRPGTAAPVREVYTGDLAYRLPDGRLVLVGRKDWQVKLRGQRMNLLEIEQALLTLENVADAAVILQTVEGDFAFLAAYIQPKAQPVPTEGALRAGLRALLPEVMIPAVFQFWEVLPRTLSGKVDRLALPPISPERSSSPPKLHVPLETPIEQALAEIWCDLLDIEQVGANDNFFDVGGDSLLASGLMERIEARFQCKYPLSVLMQHETLRELAQMIAAQENANPSGALILIQPLGYKPPIFFIPGIGGEVIALRDLTLALGTARPLYGLQSPDFGESAKNYRSMEQVAGQIAQAVRAEWRQGPVILAGYSFGGHLALETARCLTAAGEPQPLVLLIDTYPPLPKHNTSWRRRARIHYDNLRRLKGAGAAAGYLWERLQRIYLGLIRQRSTRAVIQQIQTPLAPVLASQVALAAYTPAPYAGRVLLFQASQREWYVDWDPMEAWHGLISGELEIYAVPGEHDSLTKNPHAVELARQINAALDLPSNAVSGPGKH
jgi:thioesterase domain-containing protein/acyl carrier protein